MPSAETEDSRPTAERSALIVVNRRGTRGRRSLDRAIHRMEEAGIDVFVHFCQRPERIPATVWRLAAAADMVIIGGGDGTISNALPAILASGRPLGILPMGNANDLARTLGIPGDLDAAADIVVAGKRKRIDLGTINGRPFANVASLGISVEIAARLTHQLKRRWGGCSLMSDRHGRPCTATGRSTPGSPATAGPTSSVASRSRSATAAITAVA
jgi:diacylglycerol kinase family enzyme